MAGDYTYTYICFIQDTDLYEVYFLNNFIGLAKIVHHVIDSSASVYEAWTNPFVLGSTKWTSRQGLYNLSNTLTHPVLQGFDDMK